MENTKAISTKRYDLEERTLLFAKEVRNFIKSTHKYFENIEDYKQLLRSSGSIGANYIEANESLSKKDFLNRIKISRKESKETIYWLQLLEVENKLLEKKDSLINEATELMKIFGSILTKSQN